MQAVSAFEADLSTKAITSKPKVLTLVLLQRKVFVVDKTPCLSHDAVQSITGNRITSRQNDYLALQFSGERIYPAFQFDNEGKVKPGIKAALSAMSDTRSAWKIAFWFLGEGADLGGKRPIDLLDDIEWIKKSSQSRGRIFTSTPILSGSADALILRLNEIVCSNRWLAQHRG